MHAIVGGMASQVEASGQLEVGAGSQYIEWTQSRSLWPSGGGGGLWTWSGCLRFFIAGYFGAQPPRIHRIEGDTPEFFCRTVPLFITLWTGFGLYHPVIPKTDLLEKDQKFRTLSQLHYCQDVAPTTNLHGEQAFVQTSTHRASSTSLAFRKLSLVSKRTFPRLCPLPQR